jgi:hypothetical protein
MTKRELLTQLQAALTEKGMYAIDGGNGAIGANDNKHTIQNAIECLQTPDETMREYLTVIKLAYPNIHRTITENGRDWLTHRHNRMWVYNNARMIIGGVNN